MNAEPCWLSELGNLRAYSSGGSHKSWYTKHVNKLLPGRSWRLGFTVGESQRENVRKVPTGSLELWGGL